MAVYSITATGAHPRSRGENAVTVTVSAGSSGSSPLTRGKPPRGCSRSRNQRLIPAHAGKTSPCSSGRPLNRAHPRSRGENRRVLPTQLGSSGSSPLTRGKHVAGQRRYFGRRLIPAHAGKTAALLRAEKSPAAHPRSRGENLVLNTKGADAEGSSPLTRGKPGVRDDVRDRRRLIPAHAGKTSSLKATSTD